MAEDQVPLRKDIETLTTQELDVLIKAFRHIQDLPTDDPNSFFQIAGYHGMPFRGAGWGNPTWWGGYCNHGNILFPTWHRAYLHRLEEALRSAPYPGCKELALPFWNQLKKQRDDENSKFLFVGSPPQIFLSPTYTYIDGTSVDNPLYSYRLGKSVVDNTTSADNVANYSKRRGYETVRYPFSGLVGQANQAKTEEHNRKLRDKGKEFTDNLLKENVLDWLNLKAFDNHDGKEIRAGVAADLEACMLAPNYTVFSNTTSAKAWNDDHMDDKDFKAVVPLEQPHNKIHLAVGGFQIPSQGDVNQYPGANGDMGENDTAAFDPIFFFHHCWIDNIFWQWQTRHHATEQLDKKYSSDVGPDYPGTNSVDSQGPTPGTPANARLTLDSPLDPFTKEVDGKKVPLTSKDVTNILTLGYRYEHIQIGDSYRGLPGDEAGPVQLLSVSGLNRAEINGSFVISTWKGKDPNDPDSKDQLLGVDAVLSRWNVSRCANCQTHLEAGGHVSLLGVTPESAKNMKFYSKIHTRKKPDGEISDQIKIRLGHSGDSD